MADEKVNLGGRPALYESVEEFKAAVEAYFEEVGSKATITGLAYHLGFESRQSFYDYEEREEFSYIVKRSRLKVESEYEAKLSGNNVAGSIFALKNMGWKDKTEQEHSGELGIKQITGMQIK